MFFIKTSIVRAKYTFATYCLSLATLFLLLDYISLNYSFMAFGHIGNKNAQEERSIKDHRNFYFIRSWQNNSSSYKDVVRGDLIVFKVPIEVSHKKLNYDQTKPNFIKYVAALEGDLVEINANQEIIVNKKVVAKGLKVLDSLTAEQKQNFYKTFRVPKHKFFVLGDTEKSFDSRYWGLVDEYEIVGVPMFGSYNKFDTYSK